MYYFFNDVYVYLHQRELPLELFMSLINRTVSDGL